MIYYKLNEGKLKNKKKVKNMASSERLLVVKKTIIMDKIKEVKIPIS